MAISAKEAPMRAIQLKQPRHLEGIEIEPPGRPAAGEAVVATHRVGVCGTDISSYLGKFPFFQYPRIPGHELGVEVLEVAPDVRNVKPGDHCSVEPYLNCGRCYACRRGQSNCCETLRVIGVMTDGGLCERFRIRADKLHTSRTLSFDQLALVETLAIGCHATDRGAPRREDHVLVIGAGPIGLSTIVFTRLTGARITVMDRVPARLDVCRRVYDVENTIVFHGDGSELETMRQVTAGDLYAVVTDATGNRHSMAAALTYLAHTGTLVYVGITPEEISFRHPAMHLKEATLKASRNALPADFQRIIRLLEDGVIDTRPWITHRTDLEGVARDFESFTRPETGVIKALVEVR
jgi:alcohol dehydrogenase